MRVMDTNNELALSLRQVGGVAIGLFSHVCMGEDFLNAPLCNAFCPTSIRKIDFKESGQPEMRAVFNW